MERAQGSSTSPYTYNFEDLELVPYAYYRLKMVDQNGMFAYSNVIYLKRIVDLETKGIQSLFPNPAHESIQVIASASENAQVEVSIVDALGRILSTNTVETDAFGILNSRIDVSKLPAGTYFIRIVDGKAINTASFVKTR